MRLARRLMGGGLAAVVLLHSTASIACSPIAVIEVEPTAAEVAEGLRACVEAHANKNAFLAETRQGQHSVEEALAFGNTLVSGEFGCLSDRTMALAILDAAIGQPISEQFSGEAVAQFRSLRGSAGPEISEERIRALVGRAWLVSDMGLYEAQRFWSAEELRTYLREPANWDLATQNLGRENLSLSHPLFVRTAMIFAEATDPASPHFDLSLAARIARSTITEGDDLLVAHHLMTRDPDDAALREAANLLGSYQPLYLPRGVESFETLEAHASYLAALLEQSSQPEMNAMAARYRSADPVLSYPEGTAVLGDWRSFFPEYGDIGEAVLARMADNFPSRALRLAQTGTTHSALLFAADGSFERMIVTSSSGSEVLDTAALRNFERYLRPSITELALPASHHGQRAVVDMPPVNWRIDANRPIRDQRLVSRTGGEITITAGGLIPADGGC